MKKLLVTTLLAAAVTGGQAQVKHQSHGYPIDPVPFTSVKVTDSFWGQRLKASREVTIPLASVNVRRREDTGILSMRPIPAIPSKWAGWLLMIRMYIRR